MERVAIIGGGPAGLAAGQVLAKHGIDFVLFEAGAMMAERKHDAADHLGCGIGGAGLFSDGKFSFFPSGTHLYTLRNRSRLRDAYDAITHQLTAAGISAPAFNEDAGSGAADAVGPLSPKDYLSTYGTLAQRNLLIAGLVQGYEGRIRAGTQVETIVSQPDGYLVGSRAANGISRAETFSHLAIATGRFGAQALARMPTSSIGMSELRYEFGIRIEHPNGVGFLNVAKRPDVKYILDAVEAEVRTFCTCRNGEIWMIPYGDVAALSGRSDGPPSGYSNFGLLARFTGNNLERGRQIWRHVEPLLGNDKPAIWQPLFEFLDIAPGVTDDAIEAARHPWFPQQRFQRGDVAKLLHPELFRILADGARRLVSHFPDMATPETVCIFPAVEGVGAFPIVGSDLGDDRGRIWYCGDIVGRFRGLVPALVSGHYAGAAIAGHLRENALAAAQGEWQPVPAQ